MREADVVVIEVGEVEVHQEVVVEGLAQREARQS